MNDDQDSTPPDVTQNLLQQLPKSNSAIITTDCKSLYDLISRAAPPSCSSKFMPSGAQVADSRTKAMDHTMLRECLRLGKYCCTMKAKF